MSKMFEAKQILKFVPRKPEQLPFIPAEEVKQRNGKDNSDLWLVIDDVVYDCTSFACQHPGGEAPIKNFAGKDCSWQYHQIHGSRTNAWLSKLQIGKTKEVNNPYDKPSTEHVEFARFSIGQS